jgi:tellurite resistance protein
MEVRKRNNIIFQSMRHWWGCIMDMDDDTIRGESLRVIAAYEYWIEQIDRIKNEHSVLYIQLYVVVCDVDGALEREEFDTVRELVGAMEHLLDHLEGLI